MAEKKPNTSLQNALQGRMMGKGRPELRSDIKELLDTLEGDERVEGLLSVRNDIRLRKRVKP